MQCDNVGSKMLYFIELGNMVFMFTAFKLQGNHLIQWSMQIDCIVTTEKVTLIKCAANCTCVIFVHKMSSFLATSCWFHLFINQIYVSS